MKKGDKIAVIGAGNPSIRLITKIVGLQSVDLMANGRFQAVLTVEPEQEPQLPAKHFQNRLKMAAMAKNGAKETTKYYVIEKPEGLQVVKLTKSGRFMDSEAMEQLKLNHPTATKITKASNKQAQQYRAFEQLKAKGTKKNGFRAKR